MVNGVSVIICCYNSAALIGKTLEHIAAQRFYAGLRCEVILVNNASTDNTSEKSLAIWSEIKPDNIDFKIVDEAQPGLAFARKKGIAEARFEYLIFCDDDNWLDENYIQNTVKLFDANPDAGILGGMGSPEFEDISARPFWFDKFYHGYAVGPQAEKEGKVNGVYGAGMCVRKSILEKLITNEPVFLHGRKQNELTAGEDGEIFYRMQLAGYQILYSPRLTFKHFLTAKRLTWNYLKKLHIGFSKSFVVMNLYEKALTTPGRALPAFYWFSKALYYWGIYLKYWPKHYLAYKNNEGTIEEIHHITWKNIAWCYLQYNFKTIKIYDKIVAFKHNG